MQHGNHREPLRQRGSLLDADHPSNRVLFPRRITLSRRAATVDVPRPRAGSGADHEPVHLLVDSTGLKLCGAGEWLVEKHGTRKRRSWRKLHIGVDASTGEIIAAVLTTKDVDDASEVVPCWSRWWVHWLRSRPTARMTKTVSMML